MKIRDLEGQVHVWSLQGYEADAGICDLAPSNKSSLHLQTRTLLKELYPTLTICEEVPITLRRGQLAYLDFYVPKRKMAVEVQGEQHFKYIPHFHHTLASYAKARRRDEEKEIWCMINRISLIKFLWSESIEKWKSKLV